MLEQFREVVASCDNSWKKHPVVRKTDNDERFCHQQTAKLRKTNMHKMLGKRKTLSPKWWFDGDLSCPATRSSKKGPEKGVLVWFGNPGLKKEAGTATWQSSTKREFLCPAFKLLSFLVTEATWNNQHLFLKSELTIVGKHKITSTNSKQ